MPSVLTAYLALGSALPQHMLCLQLLHYTLQTLWTAGCFAYTCLIFFAPANLRCPADFVDSGAMAALVPMLLQRQEAAREAALEAIGALCSFNQAGRGRRKLLLRLLQCMLECCWFCCPDMLMPASQAESALPAGPLLPYSAAPHLCLTSLAGRQACAAGGLGAGPAAAARPHCAGVQGGLWAAWRLLALSRMCRHVHTPSAG